MSEFREFKEYGNPENPENGKREKPIGMGELEQYAINLKNTFNDLTIHPTEENRERAKQQKALTEKLEKRYSTDKTQSNEIYRYNESSEGIPGSNKGSKIQKVIEENKTETKKTIEAVESKIEAIKARERKARYTHNAKSTLRKPRDIPKIEYSKESVESPEGNRLQTINNNTNQETDQKTDQERTNTQEQRVYRQFESWIKFYNSNGKDAFRQKIEEKLKSKNSRQLGKIWEIWEDFISARVQDPNLPSDTTTKVCDIFKESLIKVTEAREREYIKGLKLFEKFREWVQLYNKEGRKYFERLMNKEVNNVVGSKDIDKLYRLRKICNHLIPILIKHYYPNNSKAKDIHDIFSQSLDIAISAHEQSIQEGGQSSASAS